eukprot:PITA_33960
MVCCKCRKEGHYKRDYKSKAPNKGKGFDDAPSAYAKTTLDEGGDVYLASSSTHVVHEAWLIDSGASFHFTSHRDWFCEYEKYDGGDVFLGDDRKARIVSHRKVKLKFQGGRVRTLSCVLHIPTLDRNLISVSKLDDACVKTVFEMDTCKMVREALEAIDSEDGKLWKEAMVDEIAYFHKNEAWDLVEFPCGRKPIGSIWVFKKKTNEKGKVEKYKARLVAKGYSQVSGIDFGDIFSPIAKVTSIRLFLSVAATFDFEVE